MSEVEFAFGDGYIYLGSQMSWVPFPIPEKAVALKPKPEPKIKKNKKNKK